MNALIADDNRGTTAILSKALRKWQVDVAIAHDGIAAWHLLTEGHVPSLALIDWMMPGIDGPELCRRIRATPALAHMYVIMLTGRDSRADMVMGLDAGADDYIVKPFDAEELRARVQVGIRVATLQERLAERVLELQSTRDELARLASTDVLTGLFNRRQWFELAGIELIRSRRYEQPFSLLTLDLDHFKRINDTHGHGLGDEVLKRFANVLQTQCRASDIVGRLGGEEFAVLLPQTSLRDAQDVARRIVEACRTIAVPTPAGNVTVTCSIGATEASVADPSLETMLERSDRALYQAKHNGRDGLDVLAPALPISRQRISEHAVGASETIQ
jgi:diguanylate cyclase (GGDEF)-like protein